MRKNLLSANEYPVRYPLFVVLSVTLGLMGRLWVGGWGGDKFFQLTSTEYRTCSLSFEVLSLTLKLMGTLWAGVGGGGGGVQLFHFCLTFQLGLLEWKDFAVLGATSFLSE